MELSHLTENLNAEQQAAVTAGQQHVLVLAGAGSGKTRVLVHRIAWLMSHEHVSPHAILAVTFTNKAAYEMRGRIEALQGVSLSSMWVGTFHGLSHRLLRAHWKEANLPQSFQILDSDDQLRIIKRVHRNLNLDEAKWPPKQSQWYINKKKDDGLRPAQIVDDNSFHSDVLIQVYRAYEDVCQRSGLVDFAELILRALELLEKNPSISEHYQNRFRHILVDEFQDTNTIQYRWLQIFTGQDSSIMAVGDDDQSIYSWRGAQVENIHRFTRDFKGVLTIRLEQNYRSTQTILDAANAVIENNSGRLGKNLWTEGSTGEKITLYAAFNERDEAYFIVNTIQNLMRRGDYRYQDVAILYRSNAQSRVFEERFIDAQIPYRIYGGLKFFERMEIKDALAYLRVLSNRDDDAAFERIINTPTRGIGNATIELLRETARDNGASLWQSAEFLSEGDKLAARAKNALSAFLTLINSLENETKDRDLGSQTDHVLKESGLMAMYQKDRSEQGISRLENLEELVNATSEFKPEKDENLTPLAAFLAHVALETGEGQAEVNTDCVNLMTLHSAKGLEFPIVFISGMEENLFPHRMSTDEPNGLEEERRLCYVGVTRAREKLYLTYAECRHLYGREQFNSPSRFIYEIPEKLIDAVRPTTKVSRPTSTYYDREDSQIVDCVLQMGQRVRHQKFGTGTIINYEGSRDNLRLQVKFDNRETKWLVASFANLEAI